MEEAAQKDYGTLFRKMNQNDRKKQLGASLEMGGDSTFAYSHQSKLGMAEVSKYPWPYKRRAVRARAALQ